MFLADGSSGNRLLFRDSARAGQTLAAGGFRAPGWRNGAACPDL